MWWLIIRTPTGVSCWPVGDDEAERAHLVAAARITAGMPADEAWVGAGTGWDVQLIPNEPRPEVLAAATVGAIDELRKVDRTAVAAYDAARLEWSHRGDAGLLAEVFARIDDTALADVLARPEVAARLDAVSVSVDVLREG